MDSVKGETQCVVTCMQEQSVGTSWLSCFPLPVVYLQCLSSHPVLIRFVQHVLCLRVVSRLSSATDSYKLTKTLEAKKTCGVPAMQLEW